MAVMKAVAGMAKAEKITQGAHKVDRTSFNISNAPVDATSDHQGINPIELAPDLARPTAQRGCGGL